MKKLLSLLTCLAVIVGMSALSGCSGDTKDKPAVKKDKDAPAKDAPAKDAPAKDAPAKDAPAKDAPAKDAPKK